MSILENISETVEVATEGAPDAKGALHFLHCTEKKINEFLGFQVRHNVKSKCSFMNQRKIL